MTIQEAINFLKSESEKTSKKTEVKLFDKFVNTLIKLQNREFTSTEIQAIEKELSSYNLDGNGETNFKTIKKAYAAFETFLKDSFSLTPKDYYLNKGISLGILFGMLFGIVTLSSVERSLGISLGMAFGMLIGLVIDKSMDSKAKNEFRVI